MTDQEKAHLAVSKLQKEIPSMKERAEKWIIDTEKKAMDAGLFITELNQKKKSINSEITPMKTQAYQSYKKVADFVDRVLDPIDEIIAIIKPKIASFLCEENQKRQATADKIAIANQKIQDAANKNTEAALKKGDFKTAHKIDNQIQKQLKEAPEKISPVGTDLIDNWQYEIMDTKKIPERYWLPSELDTALIAKEIRLFKEKAAIPGLRIFNKPTLRFK